MEDRSRKRSHKLNNRSLKNQNVSIFADFVAKEHSHGSTVWKVSPKFFSFVVCNPCQSSPSLTILLPLWLIIISFLFVYLCIVLFLVFLQFRCGFVDGQNKSKYHNYALLILDHCRSQKQKRRTNQQKTRFIFPSIWFSPDHKRRKHQQNRCSASHFVVLIFTRSFNSLLFWWVSSLDIEFQWSNFEIFEKKLILIW